MMRTTLLILLCAGAIMQGWSIATEGRSPNERPDWWKPYENAPALEVSPDVIAPKGHIPSVAEEAVTRNAPAGVPETLVVGSDGAAQGAQGLPAAIDGNQVLQEAARNPDGKRPIWRGFALFGAFLLLGAARCLASCAGCRISFLSRLNPRADGGFEHRRGASVAAAPPTACSIG